MLNAPKSQRSFESIGTGTHVATCFQLLHIGTINEPFDGQPREVSKVRLTFEFPHEMREFKEGDGEKPLVLSQEYTLSMGKKSKLRPLIEGMLGKTFATDDEAFAFDVESLVGKSCLLAIAEKIAASGNTYAIIASASPLMKGMETPPQINETNILTYQKWDQGKFDKLPEFLRKKMEGSREFEEMVNKKGTEPNPSDIPF